MTDVDDDLNPLERIRKTAHRDTDRVCDTWPSALIDAQSRGYGTGRTYDGSPRGNRELTSVEAAASQHDFATAWIAELGDVLENFNIPIRSVHAAIWNTNWTIRTTRAELHVRINQTPADMRDYNKRTLRLHRLAESAWQYWPDPPKQGQTIQGVTIGARTNTVETCGLCNQPVAGGHADPIRRIDGQAFHGKSCWFNKMRGLTYERIIPSKAKTA